MIEKKSYESPKLRDLGTIEDKTLAQGSAGSDDQFLWITWGTNPPGTSAS